LPFEEGFPSVENPFTLTAEQKLEFARQTNVANPGDKQFKLALAKVENDGNGLTLGRRLATVVDAWRAEVIGTERTMADADHKKTHLESDRLAQRRLLETGALAELDAKQAAGRKLQAEADAMARELNIAWDEYINVAVIAEKWNSRLASVAAGRRESESIDYEKEI
jgi:hypothetical protein